MKKSFALNSARMVVALAAVAIPLLCSGVVSRAFAFCGFYVAKADTNLYNEASKVVMVRDGNRTVLTMANDFKGDVKEFALVIPVPTFIEKDQIHVANAALIDHLDAYSAPRLVEYYDENPCNLRRYKGDGMLGAAMPLEEAGPNMRAENLGVKIEAQYTVGEYDIIILSAAQGQGLETWLKEEGYKIPAGAAPVLESYIKQGTKFFVAKVNLEEQSKLGFKFLRPIQVAFESPKFMLPIRLGTVNAKGPQELFIFALTRQGRVESTNYRTTKLPEGMDVPLYVKDEFSDFYKAMFSHQVEEQSMHTLFTEYAWDMSWCDPCASNPLSNDELQELGVFWLDSNEPVSQGMRYAPQGGSNVFLTRLHVRYDREHFPEDLQFQTTGDKSNFQARYVLRHPWTGSDDCEAAKSYRTALAERQEKEVQTLVQLTGWDAASVRTKAGVGQPSPDGDKWWKKIWKK